ncbi:FAD-dependent oxidoreductase [Corynebacterium alimapuense]|uniref:Flavoprotein n=1 Tax=Corynebacterium alimapuense TaxID=1576874 RepID=A0A3M8KB42_9CORY|nr:FAD-dependent oxidoreductase [Corynebacterium alimapuense]RNE49678.1 flavoprotein [Corynebacterium alimapuense]
MTSPLDKATGTDVVVVIGAGPVGLAAAAHLSERGLSFRVLEQGDTVGAAISQWGHTRLFSPWEFNIDTAARRLLESHGWIAPADDGLPTGHELRESYLEPLAAIPELASAMSFHTRVIAVSKLGMDKTRTAKRDNTPFIVRVEHSDGNIEDIYAAAVIDTSGTWSIPNPLGQAGLPAPGERQAREQGLITQVLPDILGRDRERFIGKEVLVVGAGHSAANSLLELADLAEQYPDTKISWAVRSADVNHVYGGEDNDELAARGALGSRLRRLVSSGDIQVHTSTVISSFEAGERLSVHGQNPDGQQLIEVDLLVPATGFRPDLTILSELRLELDIAVEAPAELGPLIDPEFHSCGSVSPHGERVLAHPEKNFYIAGMKSYGRAPTFLMATGYEQVRSIVAALAGDRAAADAVHLDLPETGVCTTDLGGSCDAPAPRPSGATGSVEEGCCGAAPVESEVAEPAESGCCGGVEPAEPVVSKSAPSGCCTPAPQMLGLSIPARN